MECKSGYGLTVDSELKLLEVNQFLSEQTPMDIHSTLVYDALKGTNMDNYVDELIHVQLPAVVEQGYAKYADVFRTRVVSLEHTELIVKAAKKLVYLPDFMLMNL